ncbi:anthranilate synthase component II [Candidatus Phycosocius spiralis]|uniref:Aminodeoxychorismate/anthranilate synthase component II n=1 Tax=Candidatus Phycosocius spiralis TaxID=2815099 RepID=A0ABQ4PT38_9PROT|nr:aminodeoxychorismate/anthranilate synthase component II [Candidatus Phycosocius spiralis]GIU66161.1 aminodeoxychorismate/anthranilate synthase component II [Candidatus Phycosocius spiralis]
MKILLIDNYDSFTYNLVHYVEELGASTTVVRNDVLSVEEALAQAGDGIILSPGPCTPNEAGICLALIKAAPHHLPLMGVCLGYQAIGQAYGGKIVRAKSIMHGKTSTIHHANTGLFAGLPDQFVVARYHSLAIEPESLPPVLRQDAWTDDGEIMGISHREKPVYGVLFHPESIASEQGHAIIDRFLTRARAAKS